MNSYENEAKARWEGTDVYNEYTEKTANYTQDRWKQANDGLTTLIIKFAECKKSGSTPDSIEAQTLVSELQNHITEHFYTCTEKILEGLGQMYVADKRFKSSFDKRARGTAEFVHQAIEIYCKER